MTAREHEVDRVARAMTAGTPGAAFTKRVMAPIYGRPQPGFTARVMARLDATRAPRPVVTLALRPVAAVGLTLAVVAMLWLPSRLVLPAAPPPALVRTSVGEPAFETPDPVVRPMGTPRAAARVMTPALGYPDAPVSSVAAAEPDDPGRPLYRIAELAPPIGLAIRTIVPARPAVAPLERPTALVIQELRFEEEKP